MLPELIGKVVEGNDLTCDEAVAAMNAIMGGEATDAQIGAFITALRMKGETVDEIAGCARVMREKATRVDAGVADAVDTCGTGGDASHTFNISTATALAAAGAGVVVAKHGNRSVTSGSGSADVLRELGVNIEAPVPVVEACLKDARIGFLFAPLLHGAMKYAIGPRREIKIRTIFNVLGPLTNPAGARRQLLGVYAPALVKPIANVLLELGSERAYVVHSADGLDEISISAETHVAEVRDGSVTAYDIKPEDFNIDRADLTVLKVADAAESASIIRGLLDGEKGPPRDVVVLNAAAAIAAGGRADGIADAVPLAEQSIDSGSANAALGKLIEVSNG